MALQLDLRHYETIVAIVELGTMTAAARELHTTQSALSHRLADAERRLDQKLFDRGPQRRLTPTRAGLVMHQSAQRALADLERSERILLADRRGVTSMVRIAAGSYDCYHWYPEFLAVSTQRDPDIELDLVVGGDAPGDALAAGTVDLVLAPGEPQGNVHLTPMLVDELVLVVAADHPLADRAHIVAEDLVDQNYLTYNPSPTPGFEYDKFIRPSGDYPRIVRVVPQTSAIVELVAAGTGVSILSRWALSPSIDSGRIAAVRCGPDGLPLTWSVVTRASAPVDSPTRRVAEHLAVVVGNRGARSLE
jgi:LysR family transcriptional regulator for metE and metH